MPIVQRAHGAEVAVDDGKKQFGVVALVGGHNTTVAPGDHIGSRILKKPDHWHYRHQMGFFRSSRTPAPDLLHAFAQAQGLVRPQNPEVDDFLPRSCQVVDAHQLHSRWNDYRYVYYAFVGTLPGGIEGGIAHVNISGNEVDNDCFDIVRAPAPQDVLVPTLEVQGPLNGDLRAYGGHRTADVPFRAGDARTWSLPGARRHRARVPSAVDEATAATMFDSGFGTWVAETNPPFSFELFDGWISVFRLESREEPDAAVYPALCDATARFAAACRGAPMQGG
ncbi:MAG: hypothetical protein IPG03_14100 [Candidatus Microthrix sp.]|nr:hypothetical protein [Candidatus Microthrix sp.]MBK6503431.1 hypothetical protein [Candidatus Microthrix sp.]